MKIERSSFYINAANIGHTAADCRPGREIAVWIAAWTGSGTEWADEAIVVLPAGFGFLAAGFLLQTHRAAPVAIRDARPQQYASQAAWSQKIAPGAKADKGSTNPEWAPEVTVRKGMLSIGVRK